MQGSRRTISLALMMMLAMAGNVLAGGFSIYEAGSRATALGGAFTATADNGSALFYNPAGMSFLEGPMLDLNITPIIPGSKFTGAEPYNYDGNNETSDQTFLIPGLYYTRPATEKISFGVGLYAPFGLGVKWENPTTWVGRYSSYDVDLATVYVTPAVSYLVNDQLAVSIGADVAHQAITLNKYSGYPFGGSADGMTNVVNTTVDGTSNLNFTPCAGLMYRPTPKLSLGVMYHHKKTLVYEDGDATMENVAPAALAGIVDATVLTPAGGTEFLVDTEFNLPAILALGASYKLSEKLRVEVDGVYWGWSHFEQLVLDFQQTAEQEAAYDLDQEIYEGYVDKWQIRAGLEFTASESWQLMAGYVYDDTPQPVESMGPLLPDASRNDFSFGVQHTRDKWVFNASFMAVLFDERSTVDNGVVSVFDNATAEEVATRNAEAGTYSSIANIFGLSIGYHF